jgi:glycerol 3-phosphatase-2
VAEAGPTSLSEAYDLVMFDLDGVVYVDGRAVPRAPEGIAHVRETGSHVAFITNNASRTPDEVAAQLRDLGVGADARDVVTSAQAAARVLHEQHGDRARIAVLGAEGLVVAVRDEGLVPVGVDDDYAAAIVSGYAPEARWREIMRAAMLIRNGLPWVATNTDLTLPTGTGPAPGHGVLVKMISEFAQVEPVVAGKPLRPLFDETLRRVGGDHPLMVGDRLDTDIAGAHVAGTDSLLVMTGVTDLAGLVAAAPDERPTHVGHDLDALGRPACQASDTDGGWRADGWTARVTDGGLEVTGSGGDDGWWSAVAAAAWAHLDSTGDTARVDGLTPPGDDRAAG